MNSRYLILFAGMLAGSSNLGAGIITVTNATYEADATYMSNFTVGTHVTDSQVTPGTVTEQGTSATLSVAQGATLSSQSIGQGTNTRTGAHAIVNYYFTVSGPQNGLTVPVNIQFILTASALGKGAIVAQASSEIELDRSLAVYKDDEAHNMFCPSDINGKMGVMGGPCEYQVTTCSPSFPCFTTSGLVALDATGTAGVDSSFNVNLLTGDVHEITLEVNTLGGEFNIANAFADPYISIDPNFAGASDYSIIQSAGVANGLANAPTATPEPVSFALFGIGLAGVIFFRRRSKKQG